MNNLRNWYYKDVIGILFFFGFERLRQKGGSHEVWINKQKQEIELYFSNNNDPYSVKGMIKILKNAEIPQNIAKIWTNTRKQKRKLRRFYELNFAI